MELNQLDRTTHRALVEAGYAPLDEYVTRFTRPLEPKGTDNVWYRGWEVGYSADAGYWSDDGWIAYKGGCDLDAQEVRAATYEACLDLIDDEEDE